MITCVSFVAFASTQAFFSDTETSRGNILKAGAIDLTVDSEAHYNGMVCVNHEWSDCEYVELTNSLIANPSFENPEVTDSAHWQIFTNGTEGLGWTVEWESAQTEFGGRTRPTAGLVEYHEGVMAGWNAYEGDQYAELDTDWFGPSDSLNNEPALVRIYQNIPTELGKEYKLKYAYSPRPDVTSAADNTLIVRLDGAQVQTQSRGGNGSTTDWTTHEYLFNGTGSNVKVEFAAGGTANSLGVFLDSVRVYVMGDSCTPVAEYSGIPCEGTWDATDLSLQSEKFFNLADLKPGDWGENTISLHVESNDAYACMAIYNLHDDEVSYIEPEYNEGGDGVDDDNGELSQYLSVVMWHDDGDNTLEANETLITNGVELASDIFDDKEYAVALHPTPIAGGATKYLGLAWCFGTMTIDDSTKALSCDGTGNLNAAQTDSMSADLAFYVEQARHNGSFTCDGVLEKIMPEPRLSDVTE